MVAGKAPGSGPDPETIGLAEELRAGFRSWGEGGAWPGEGRSFGELALRAFRLQHRGNPIYRRYCDARGAGPDVVSDWRRIPPVPTAAFRSVELVTGAADAEALRFRTSGTSRGPGDRGTHVVRDPGLYRASAEAAFRRFVLEPPGLAPLSRARFCSLVPPFPESDGSSLAWMVDAVMERFGAPASVHAASAAGLELERATTAAEEAAREGEPLCVLTTTLALDAWTRELEERERMLPLPAGSRIMDTGGAKGREGLSRADVLERTGERLRVGPERVVNEFGMTELASQRYSHAGDPGRDAARGTPEAPVLHGPPWLRTRVLDPVSLEPRPEGEAGILHHHDLANLWSVCGVLTEDRGRATGEAVQWMGRTEGSPPRGCSLATAELLSSA